LGFRLRMNNSQNYSLGMLLIIHGSNVLKSTTFK
jgi:hypothetical protein